MKRSSVCVVGLIFLPVLAAFGQGYSFNGSSGPNGEFRGAASFSFGQYMPPARVNAPYSGEQVSESSQTLADGTHITRPMARLGEKTWRDSQGRVRTERPFGMGGMDLKGTPAIAEITDPVAGYTYVLDNVNRVAHRVKMEATPQGLAAALAMAHQGAAAAAGGRAMTGLTGAQGTVGTVVAVGGGGGGGTAGSTAAMANRIEMARREAATATIEDLGTKTIDGVLVYGTRRTTIIPEGAQGNDRPMTTTNEMWRSKDLGLMVLSTSYNPASGTSTNRIANLSTAEPDPALFIVPADYTIVDEAGSFTIKWGEQ
jgi:hypothetical protein